MFLIKKVELYLYKTVEKKSKLSKKKKERKLLLHRDDDVQYAVMTKPKAFQGEAAKEAEQSRKTARTQCVK